MDDLAQRDVAGLLASRAVAVLVLASRGRAARSTPGEFGYARYEGLHDEQDGLDVWKGIRYAAPPIGELRWQEPRDAKDESGVGIMKATEQPDRCPQTGAFGTPAAYGFNGGPDLGSEDCLFVNVYAPRVPRISQCLSGYADIDGGGYSLFGAPYDPSVWITTGGHRFIAVEIQYRLGAFGYLASRQIQEQGVLDVGLLDQRAALRWVQKYITKFGGDPRHVTVAGESSGAGSVLHQALAYNGRDDALFTNIYISSPYLPTICKYDDPVPTDHLRKFAQLAGCDKRDDMFACLVVADSAVLQNASNIVSTTRGYFGSFAWLPVVDNDFIQRSPVAQLLDGAVVGKNALVGTNANEGVPLANPRVKDRLQYDAFIVSVYPGLGPDDRDRLAKIYQIDEALTYGKRPTGDTTGTKGPTALVRSGFATGIQQAVFNIAAESTFQCPAQWLADAFGDIHRKVFKYQYSLTPSFHGADLSAMFSLGNGTEAISKDFRDAFQNMLSAFVATDNPIISADIATVHKYNATAPVLGSDLWWPQYTRFLPLFMNLNTTGGEEVRVTRADTLRYLIRTGEGVVNTFSTADARFWEGGRASRCNFWKYIASRVPYWITAYPCILNGAGEERESS